MRFAVFAVILAVGWVHQADAQDGATLRAAAEQGSLAAQYRLGIIYANGDSGAVDYAQAAQWFERAARGGHVDARRHLVFMRQMGMVPGPPAAPGGPGLFRVQVASVASEGEAPREWRRLQRRYPEMLGPLEASVIAFEGTDGARSYRVQGGPLDEDGARAVCQHLRVEGATCMVIRP